MRLLVGSLGVLVCSWVCILTLLFWYVFTQGYLDPRRPRAPPYACTRLCASARLCTCVRAYVRLRAFPLALLGASISLWLRHVVPVRFLAPLGSLWCASWFASLSASWVSCASQVLASFCFYTLLHDTMLASFALWCRFGAGRIFLGGLTS